MAGKGVAPLVTEKRKSPRIAPFLASCLVLEGERPVPGFLMDLSLQGARVACEENPPKSGGKVVLDARLGRRHGHLRLGCLVKWVHRTAAGGYTFGLRFDDIGAVERGVLVEAIEDFRRRAAAIS
jgi:hypothetical protein